MDEERFWGACGFSDVGAETLENGEELYCLRKERMSGIGLRITIWEEIVETGVYENDWISVFLNSLDTWRRGGRKDDLT